ncbi:hypothetical protein PR202_gb26428 [Eleusine coracana subsp. coracana]|uniref:Leucine-rich repeat-containing N-terminal plant-type domain-containing protein n=1 Tax=Eleusine coracana subsp. coracana TaxID=191504 RepID=A0AAV5FP68_ELECO|nr:hypothetical protein PR202_gb26428 [Eleusine coracana subsp. coracana]
MSSLTLLLLLLCSISLSTLLIAAAETGDEAALLAFKAAAVHRDGVLASWNVSSSAGGFCRWEGVTCQQGRVVALSLPSRGLAGVLSPAVGNLSSLRTLNLSYNALHGAIPASIGRLHRLEVLDLSNNAFSGELPAANLTSCTSLRARATRAR